MTRYRVQFEARESGAIGIFTWTAPIIVEADDAESARDKAREQLTPGTETRGVHYWADKGPEWHRQNPDIGGAS